MWHSSRENVDCICRVGIAIFSLHVWTAVSWTAEPLIDEAVIHQWEAYERFARKLQGTALYTSVSSGPDGEKEQRSRLVFRQNEACASWSSSREEGDPTEQVRIGNPKYLAVLKRSGVNLGDVVLERFSETQEGPKQGAPPVFEHVVSNVSPHFFLHNKIPLSRILVDPHLKILKTSRISENGRELIRMDYRDEEEQSTPRLRHVFANSGWVDLDPSRCWCIVRTKTSYEATTNGERRTYNEAESELSTIVHPSGFPLVKKITSRGTQHLYRNGKERTVNNRTTMDFEWEVNDSVPIRSSL